MVGELLNIKKKEEELRPPAQSPLPRNSSTTY